MDRNNVFKNTLFLTLSGIIAKTLDFSFRAFYSKKLGGEGCGLLSLVFSVHSIMLTLATAGISVATAKLISQSIAEKDIKKAHITMKAALFLTASASAVIILFGALFSKEIASHLLKEERAAAPLLFLLPSVGFMSISYCLKGYFYSARKVLIPASSEFLEQFIKILSISCFLKKALPLGIEKSCSAVFLGLSLGEFSSFLYLSMFYRREYAPFKSRGIKIRSLVSVLKTALPAMATSLSGSYLHMREELLMVSGLKKYGFAPKEALSLYGTICGMSIPLTMFPLSLLSSFLTLLVPEISRAAARKTKTRLSALSEKIYHFSSLTAFLLSAVFFCNARGLSLAVYNSRAAGEFIPALAAILPLVMTDSISTGILNGLGRQTFLLFLTISESALRIALCFFLVPKAGPCGIIPVIAAGSLFSFSIKLFSAMERTSAKKEIVKSLVSSGICAIGVCLILKFPLFTALSLPFGIFFSSALYILFAAAFKALTKDDFLWIFKRMKGIS